MIRCPLELLNVLWSEPMTVLSVAKAPTQDPTQPKLAQDEPHILGHSRARAVKFLDNVGKKERKKLSAEVC